MDILCIYISCIFDKLSREIFDLKLSKNVKVMFIFNTKLVFYCN